MRNPRTQLSRAATMTAAVGLSLALAACGGGGESAEKPTATAAANRLAAGSSNGLESRPASEIVATAAQALKTTSSVRYLGRGTEDGTPSSAELRMTADGTVTGVLDGNGQRVEILRVAGVAYVRGPSAAGPYPGARTDQWINTGPVGAADDDLSINSAADAILDLKADIDGGEDATVEQMTEQGQPAVRVATKTASLYVANVGQPVPLRQVFNDANDRFEVTFTEYGSPVPAAVPTDAFQPRTTPTS
ncbi:hypothetical protein IHE48_02060 [Frankia sp. CH37]|nr:hypothetical protein [Parafrankia sp. CH37]